MKIRCPSCGFSRSQSEEISKTASVIAICPKCACRFRFSFKDETATIIPDDPLPEGALIFSTQEQENTQTPKPEQEVEEAKVELKANEQVKAAGGNPWDRAPGRIGWFSSFFQTCFRVMFAAQRFFSQLAAETRLFPALVFYLLISCLEFLISYGWMHVIHSVVVGTEDAQLDHLLSLLSPDGNLFSLLLVQAGMSIVKIHITTALFYCIFQVLTPKTNNFSLIFQVVAYSTAPTLLCIVPLVGNVAAVVWGVGCLTIGLRVTLKISWLQTVVGFLPIILLLGASMRALFSL